MDHFHIYLLKKLYLLLLKSIEINEKEADDGPWSKTQELVILPPKHPLMYLYSFNKRSVWFWLRLRLALF